MRVERYGPDGKLLEVTDDGLPDPLDRRRDLRARALRAATVAQLRDVVAELLHNLPPQS